MTVEISKMSRVSLITSTHNQVTQPSYSKYRRHFEQISQSFIKITLVFQVRSIA